MKVQRLQIEQQLARLEVSSRLAGLSIETSQRRMRVESRDARMTVERQAPEVRLDLRDFHNKNGLRDIRALADEFAAEAKARADQGIRRMAADGDAVAELPSSGNSIGRLAKSKMLRPETPAMGSGQAPYGSVKMSGDAGSLSVNWTRHDLKIEWDEYQAPQITLEPKASVNVELAREPYLEFSVVEMSIPPETGTSVDAQA